MDERIEITAGVEYAAKIYRVRVFINLIKYSVIFHKKTAVIRLS